MLHIVLGRPHVPIIEAHLEDSWTTRVGYKFAQAAERGYFFQLLSPGALLTSRPADEGIYRWETSAQGSNAEFDQ